MNTLAKLKPALALALGLALLPAAQAQQAVKFPAGLKWEMMKLAVFDDDYIKETVSPAEKNLAAEIWKEEIKALPNNNFTNKRESSSVLVGVFENDKYRYVFSSLWSGAHPECTAPSGTLGHSVVGLENMQLYPTCPMRIVRMDKSSREIKTWKQKDFCFVHEDFKNTPLDKNHTEMAVSGNVAYFRSIQYGKHVLRCDRAIQLQ